MLLLTGATGTIGMPLLRLLTARGMAVRCLVRDPRRLGPERVKVQIALGDLGEPQSFRHALRDIETVIHLAAPLRDQPAGTIEELAGAATWRLIRAAERAGATRFVFFSAIGASSLSRSRLMRAKALAESALSQSSLAHTIFAPAWVYSPHDPFLTLIERLSRLPVMPIPGAGSAVFEPICAEDVAECVLAALPGGAHAEAAAGARYELAGPSPLTYRQIVEVALRAIGRSRPLAGIPISIVRPTLRLAELLYGSSAFATWDEVELLQIPMPARRGTADVERLGVTPQPMAEVLGRG